MIEDRFTDDELRRLLTTVLARIHTDADPTPDDHARIAADMGEAIDTAIARRNSRGDRP